MEFLDPTLAIFLIACAGDIGNKKEFCFGIEIGTLRIFTSGATRPTEVSCLGFHPGFRYGIPNIRLLFEGDLRVLEQI